MFFHCILDTIQLPFEPIYAVFLGTLIIPVKPQTFNMDNYV